MSKDTPSQDAPKPEPEVADKAPETSEKRSSADRLASILLPRARELLVEGSVLYVGLVVVEKDSLQKKNSPGTIIHLTPSTFAANREVDTKIGTLLASMTYSSAATQTAIKTQEGLQAPPPIGH